MQEKPYYSPLLYGCILFSAAMLAGEVVLRLVASRAAFAVENQTLAEAAAIRSTIESQTSAAAYLAMGLSGYLSLAPELAPDDINRMLRALHRHGSHIRNISIAPGNRITWVYPPEGNEEALGLHYESLPAQWPDVKRAIDTRQNVIAGPIPLVQGGFGLVSRTPVFREDGGYWGMISIVIDIQSLLEATASSLPPDTPRWALRASQRYPTGPRYFFGEADLFAEDRPSGAASLAGDNWEIAVAPRRKGGLQPLHQWLIRLMNTGIALAFGVMAFLVLRERERARHLADHDMLTGLPNRRLLFERLEQCTALSRRYGANFCILYLDLNSFKPINDQYGHQAGDLVLKETARRMRERVRASDTVARIGGDEFAVLLPDTREIEGARAVADNLLRALEEPIASRGRTLHVSAAIGIGRFPDHGNSAEALMNRADEAMYRAKSGEGGNIVPPEERDAGEAE